MLFTGLKAFAFEEDTLFICKNTYITYKDSIKMGEAVSWQWTFQGGNPGSSTLQYPTAVLYTNAGVFLTTIKITFNDNTDTTDQIVIVVYDYPMPDFYFPKDTGYCQGSSFPLELNTTTYPGLIYEWSNGSRSSSITVNGSGKYWVQLLVKGGNWTCDSVYKEVNITEYPNPSVYLGQDKLMCQNQNIPLDAGTGQGWTYIWKPGNEVTRTINVNLPGVYSVEVTNTYGCKASDEVEFKDSCPHYVFVPNAVSPNADRLNDLFVKVWNFTPSDYTFRIYNRWGEQLFETNDPNAGWDCKVNDVLVQQDIYVYKITYFDTDKRWYELRGTFYVVR